MRHHIDELLLDIWRDPAQKKALTRLAVEAAAAASKSTGAEDSQLDDPAARGGGVLLVNYARAMLNSLMYMLGVRCWHARCSTTAALHCWTVCFSALAEEGTVTAGSETVLLQYSAVPTSGRH
jgi:hypothetical protein